MHMQSAPPSMICWHATDSLKRLPLARIRKDRLPMRGRDVRDMIIGGGEMQQDVFLKNVPSCPPASEKYKKNIDQVSTLESLASALTAFGGLCESKASVVRETQG